MQDDDLDVLTRAVKRSTQQRIDTRAITTLMGICTGIAADSTINDQEIAYLQTWLLEHESIKDQWPASAIHYRIKEILADGIISNEERQELLKRLQELTGNHFNETGAAAVEAPILPVDDDPSIFFKYMNYCFTGEFLYGTRAACERAVLKLGATAQNGVTKKLNYLVIGSRCTPEWVNESFGRKIELAMRYRGEGLELYIISEKQWTDAMMSA